MNANGLSASAVWQVYGNARSMRKLWCPMVIVTTQRGLSSARTFNCPAKEEAAKKKAEKAEAKKAAKKPAAKKKTAAKKTTAKKAAEKSE